MTKPPISEAHERLNQIRRWLKSHPHYFRPTHLVLLRSVIEDVATPEHVGILQAYVRAWKLPDEQALAQKATMDGAVRQAEADRAVWFAAREEAEERGVPDPPYPASTAPEGSEGNTPGHTPAPSTQPTQRGYSMITAREELAVLHQRLSDEYRHEIRPLEIRMGALQGCGHRCY